MRGVLQAFLLAGSWSFLVSLRFVNQASQLPLPISSPQHEQLALSHSSARLPHMQAERAHSLVSHVAHCVPLSLSLSLPPSLPLPSPISPLLLSAFLTRTHWRYSASDALGAANARDATSAPPPTHLSRPALPGRRSHRCWLRRLRPIPPEPSGRQRLRAPSRSAAHRAPRSPCGGMRPPRRSQAPLKPLSTK